MRISFRARVSFLVNIPPNPQGLFLSLHCQRDATQFVPAFPLSPGLYARQSLLSLKVDLTGQVVSDSIGKRMYSGVGGQVRVPEFTRGRKSHSCRDDLTKNISFIGVENAKT